MIALGDLERQLKDAVRPESVANRVDILLPQHFVSTVLGSANARNVGSANSRNVGVRRECRIEILAQGEPAPGAPAAVFGSCGLGWLDTLEVVVLHTANRTLMWKRRDKEAAVTINGKSRGRIELGWCLRYANIGSGLVWFDGDPFCEIALPLRGPSATQTRDCKGRLTFTSDRTAIKFLIKPKEPEGSNGTMPGGAATIFDPADEARLSHISADQRLLLLALAVWPWTLYKAGATNAAGPK
jgi:hypothetical protein